MNNSLLAVADHNFSSSSCDSISSVSSRNSSSIIIVIRTITSTYIFYSFHFTFCIAHCFSQLTLPSPEQVLKNPGGRRGMCFWPVRAIKTSAGSRRGFIIFFRKLDYVETINMADRFRHKFLGFWTCSRSTWYNIATSRLWILPEIIRKQGLAQQPSRPELNDTCAPIILKMAIDHDKWITCLPFQVPASSVPLSLLCDHYRSKEARQFSTPIPPAWPPLKLTTEADGTLKSNTSKYELFSNQNSSPQLFKSEIWLANDWLQL